MGGDLVALCSSGESMVTMNSPARVVGQWTYDAYGNVLSADHIHPHAYSRVGHKGLIFDRLDVGVADHGQQGAMTPGMFIGHPTCEFDTPRLVPFAKGIYQNRNRTYMPELGRFAQADPNASGMNLLTLPIYHGGSISAGAVAWDVQTRYGDGGSLYAYLRNNPCGSSDAMGLESYVGQMYTQGGMSTLLEMQLGAMSGAAGTIHSGMFAASAGTAGMSSFGVVALGGTGGAVGTIGGAKGLFVFALGAAVVLAQTGSLVAILRSPNQQDSGGEEFHGPQSFRWVSGTSRPTSGGPYKGFFNPTTGEMILSTVSHHSQERRISDIDNFICFQV